MAVFCFEVDIEEVTGETLNALDGLKSYGKILTALYPSDPTTIGFVYYSSCCLHGRRY
jgi:hypothetical protein